MVSVINYRLKNSVTPSPSQVAQPSSAQCPRTKAWEVQNSRGSCASQAGQAQGWQRGVKGVWAGREPGQFSMINSVVQEA